MPRLIVNADDFGYTAGINRAIVELGQAGALSSATLMATGSALDDALLRLGLGEPSGGGATGGRTPSGPLGTGCHVVLVDGTAVLAPGQLPTLAATMRRAASRQATSQPHDTGTAHFRPTLGGFVADLLRGRIAESEIEQEAIAQIRRLQARGVQLTHLDTHKHTHMFPRVLRPLLRAALQCGVRAIRNPFEPAWSVRATPGAPLVRRAEVRLLGLLRPEFSRLVAEAGLRTTAGAVGVLATGTLDAQTLERLLLAVRKHTPPEGDGAIWELVCHPGYHDAELEARSTRLLAARERERLALEQSPPSLQGFSLVHFGEL